MSKLATTALKQAMKSNARWHKTVAAHVKKTRVAPPKSMFGVKIATPDVQIDGRLKERIEAAVRSACRDDHPFRRIRKLSSSEMCFAAWLLNEMLEAHNSVIAQMLHPCHGQFDANPHEAARSFVRSFAARHKIKGVRYDKAFYR